MVKILHIGHTNTPHVHDVIQQIDEHTDFQNALLSCQTEEFVPYELFKRIPVYVYNYLDFVDTPAMRSAVDNVLKAEKPDLIIGHSFSQVAVIMNYVLSVTNVPAMSFIWGSSDCVKSFKNAIFTRIYYNNLTVLKKINYLVCTNRWLNLQAVNSYGITLDDFVEAGPPVNLAQYTNHIPDTSKPRLFLAKPRCEKYIYACLPAAFKQFPKLEVHAFRVPKSIVLAKKVGVHNQVRFHNYPQTQENFANMIKYVNIVHTITPDPGTGGTAVQATYAGCVNLMRQCQSSKWMIEDGINAVMCRLNVPDVMQKLFYSVQNMPKLCQRFRENSRHLIRFDRENTWKNLHKAILNCLEGKKGRITPMVTV